MGTDEMRLVHERVAIAAGANRPSLNGQDVQTADYREQIVRGFSSAYRLLMAQRDELLAEQLPRFASDEIRFIARPTSTYARLLWESFHPNLLRDALKRDRFFDRLWLGVQREPALARLIRAEQADLLQGDVPLFTTYPESRDLLSSRGERIAAFFEEPSLEVAKKWAQGLDEDDLVRQVETIQTSFTSMFTGSVVAHVTPSRPIFSPAAVPATRERLIQAARLLGDRLCAIAVRSEDAVGWLGVTLVNEREWRVSAADAGLYGGTPGIVLFLAYLGWMTSEASYTTLAQSALPTVRYEVEQIKKRPEVASIGAFEGLGAASYLLTHLGVLWQQQALLDEAQELARLLPELIEQDKRLDIIGGSAGCIAALLCLYAVAPEEHILAAAIQCGDHLLTSAKPMSVGVGWSSVWQETPLTGFAYGAAGIAWSLLRLAEVSGQEHFRHTALAALAYERSLFSPEQQNWRDMRTSVPARAGTHEGEGDDPGMVAWCYGAAGIGLSCLDLLKYVDDVHIRQEIESALRTTMKHGFGRNHCLCHGDYGNLETLLTAARILDEPDYRLKVEQLSAMLLASGESQGWISGVPFGVETPGLMTGLAGTGYVLLRLAEPLQVPAVLLLAPPHVSKRFYDKPDLEREAERW